MLGSEEKAKLIDEAIHRYNHVKRGYTKVINTLIVEINNLETQKEIEKQKMRKELKDYLHSLCLEYGLCEKGIKKIIDGKK